ncbi:MAG: DUF1871 family protein [Acidobacteriota bacterium]
MDRLTEIINRWDPINFFPNAPENEYDIEVRAIKEQMSGCRDVQELAKLIQNVFISKFNEDIFARNIDDCLSVAREILEVYK